MVLASRLLPHIDAIETNDVFWVLVAILKIQTDQLVVQSLFFFKKNLSLKEPSER